MSAYYVWESHFVFHMHYLILASQKLYDLLLLHQYYIIDKETKALKDKITCPTSQLINDGFKIQLD